MFEIKVSQEIKNACPVFAGAAVYAAVKNTAYCDGLWKDIWERMAQIASWEQMDKRTHRQHKGMAVSSIGEILERNKYFHRRLDYHHPNGRH